MPPTLVQVNLLASLCISCDSAAQLAAQLLHLFAQYAAGHARGFDVFWCVDDGAFTGQEAERAHLQRRQ